MARAENKAGLNMTSAIHLSRVTVTANIGTSILQGRTEREESICMHKHLDSLGKLEAEVSSLLFSSLRWQQCAWADQNKYRFPCVE